MKLLHIADLHYGPRHLAWIEKAMSHAVDTAIAEKCDLAVIAGDSFDHALSTHDPAFVAYVRQVVRLAGEMTVVVLQGTFSHDRPGALDVLKVVPSAHPIIVADTVASRDIAGMRLCTLPSLNKADPAVMAEGAYAWTARTLGEFADANREARAAGMPTLLVTHGTVTGCTTESGYAMVSPDHEFSGGNLAAADADAVFLGHIHRHQSWPDVLTPSGARTTIAYPGSLARLVHGHLEPVGFLIWTIEPGSARFMFHESPARQLVEIAFDGPPDLDELRTLAADIGPDDAVRIRWSIDEEHVASVNKALIREIFAAAETVKLEPRVLPVQRIRAAGIGQARTLAERIRVWCEVTGSMPAADRLTARLERLQSADPEAIVRGIAGERQENVMREAA
jgi:exonuclease SbcD